MAEPGRAAGGRTLLLAHALEGLDAVHLARRLKRGGVASLMHIARDGTRLALIERMVRFVAPELEIVTIPAWDCLPYDRISPNGAVMAERLRALARLAAGPGRGPRLVLTTANAVVQKVPAPALVRAAHLKVAAGQRVERDTLIGYLERNGYHRTSAVVEAGDYAVRGGLVDIFPSGRDQPVRLDFFGSTLESIRSFDPLTQRSLAKVEKLVTALAADRAAVQTAEIIANAASRKVALDRGLIELDFGSTAFAGAPFVNDAA